MNIDDDLVDRLREGAELSETMPKPRWFLKAICPQAADRIENQEFIIKSKDSRIEELESNLDYPHQEIVDLRDKIEELKAEINDRPGAWAENG